jgi:hypothetical protein
MIKKFSVFSILVILALVLSACSTAQASTSTTSASSARQSARGTFQPPSGTLPAGFPAAQGGTAVPTATATPQPTATSTPTATPVSASVEAAARAYFAALQAKNFNAAAQLVSVYSLTFAEMVRSDVASQLTAQSQAGATWSDFQVVGSQMLDDSTILVHVTYSSGAAVTPTGSTSSASASSVNQTPGAAQSTNLRDEWWPFRLESSQWLYNWNNLIDFKTLDLDSQTSNHITILPTMLVRYSDRIELHFMMQNRTSDVVYFVQPYDSLAVFHFGDLAVEADKSHSIVISGLRTSFDEYIAVKGLFTSYPDWVEIKKYQGYYPNPWYTFQF